jgi:hypothetical protein
MLTPVAVGTYTLTRCWSAVNSNEICTTSELFILLFIPVFYRPVHIINSNIEERYSYLCTRHDSTDMYRYGSKRLQPWRYMGR